MTAIESRLYAVPAPALDDARGERLAPPDGAPPGPWTLDTAYRWCERLAASHYENFPVASKFLPAHLRPHIAAIYAFARTADDFADEPRYEGRRREALDAWEGLLETAYHREVEHPVFLALRDTVRRHDIPIGAFKALLVAFRMDLTRHRYGSFAELLHYCQHSANPIGQLVLFVHGHHEPHLHRFSDQICSALQVANFLQDLSVDLPRGRVYLPEEDLVFFGVAHEDLFAARATPAFRELMRFEVARCRSMFLKGQPLIRSVSPGLSMELEATWRGGMKILDRIEGRGFDSLTFRPTLDKRDVAGIAVRSLFAFGRRFLRGEA
jgi:squalene synthase HpnC